MAPLPSNDTDANLQTLFQMLTDLHELVVALENTGAAHDKVDEAIGFLNEMIAQREK